MGAYVVTKGEHENQHEVAVTEAYTVGRAGELNLYFREREPVSFYDPPERCGMTLAPGQWDLVYWDEDAEVPEVVS